MQKEKYGFIYIWRDRKHKRFYIGSHWGYEDDGYICSSTWMRHAHRRRPLDFKRKIIQIINTSRKDLFEKERQWLALIKEKELGKKYFNYIKTVPQIDNISPMTGRHHSEKSKKKISKSHIGMKHLEESKRKIREAKRGNTSSFRGKHHSEEAKRKNSEKHLGKIHLEESKRKISKSLKGHIHLEETIQKIAEANRGQKRSEETKKKMKESQIKRRELERI